jgi:LuxR family maltose regulon positive regulatory protein
MSAERIALDVIESIVFRVTGRASEAVAPARRALARIDETGGGELGAIAHQLDSLRVQCALAFFRGGAIADAAQIVARVERPVDAESDVPLQLGALSLAAAVSVVHGQMPEAARALRVIDESGSPVEVLNSYSGSLAHLARAIMGAEAGDIRTVHAHIEALDAHMPTLEYRLLFAAVQALAALWDGDPAQALHDLAALRREDAPRARISRSDERILGVTRALLYSALSETGAAQDEVRRLPVNDGLRILLDAHLMLIGRRPELAFPRLAQVNPGEHDDRLRAMRDILMACAALASGDRTAAATALRRYAATVSANGLMTPLLLVPVEHRDDMLAFAGSLGGVPVAALQRLVELPPVFRLTRIRASLTPRERDIVLGLRATSSLTTIAESLGLSRNTVKAQVRTLYRKLNVGSRSEALRAAYAQGLLSADLSPERPQDAE